MAKVAAALVVINRLYKTILFAVFENTFVWKEQKVAGASRKCLPTKSRLLIDSKATIEATKFIINVNEPAIGPKETDKRVLCSNVALETQDAHACILIYQSTVS